LYKSCSKPRNPDVACVIDAKHLCVNSRGIRDIESSTVTSEFGGKFKEAATRKEFLEYIRLGYEILTDATALAPIAAASLLPSLGSKRYSGKREQL
jgi:hypothetical protein